MSYLKHFLPFMSNSLAGRYGSMGKLELDSTGQLSPFEVPICGDDRGLLPGRTQALEGGQNTMIYASDLAGGLLEPEPGSRAFCQLCKSPVIAKCGEINVWHWAHESSEDCDHWSEPETEWHKFWKMFFAPRSCEVVIGDHRADIVSPFGLVIELQHSPITPEEIREREQFYGNMIWLIDGSEFKDNFHIRTRKDASYQTFRWRWPRKSWFAATRPVYIDFGTAECFHLGKIHHNVPCGGWGRGIKLLPFLDKLGIGPNRNVSTLTNKLDELWGAK